MLSIPSLSYAILYILFYTLYSIFYILYAIFYATLSVYTIPNAVNPSIQIFLHLFFHLSYSILSLNSSISLFIFFLYIYSCPSIPLDHPSCVDPTIFSFAPTLLLHPLPLLLLPLTTRTVKRTTPILARISKSSRSWPSSLSARARTLY